MAFVRATLLAVLAMAPVGAFVPSTFGGVHSTARVHSTRVTPVMGGKENALRDRIKSVKNTRKITEAMRLVAAAKVRRAQEAVLQTRPFSETLQGIFSGLIKRLGKEPIELPLLNARECKTVTLFAISGDRGLCGSYNNYVIKKTEARKAELEAQVRIAALLSKNLYRLPRVGARGATLPPSSVGDVPRRASLARETEAAAPRALRERSASRRSARRAPRRETPPGGGSRTPPPGAGVAALESHALSLSRPLARRASR